jgi:SAM-dependent methyltransferase
MNYVPGCPLDSVQKSHLFAQMLGNYDRWVMMNYLKVNRAPLPEAHPWVPIGLELFTELVALALQHAQPTPAVEAWDDRLKQISRKPAHYRFVDAGCGTGMTLQLAREIGHHMGKLVEVEGIELQEDLVRYAGRRGLTVFQRDLSEFDYSPYDIVYVYQPMKCMSAIMDRIRAGVRPGAVIIAVVHGQDWSAQQAFKVLFQTRGIAVALREDFTRC